MNRLVSLYFLFSSLSVVAQEDSITYTDLLGSANEIYIPDSISINDTQWPMSRLDSNAVKNWFSYLLPSTANNRLKNRAYYLAGKITGNSNFDLLIVVEEKKKIDSTSSQIVYLITNKKDGTHVASLEIAAAGAKRKSNFITYSWLYKDYKIVQDSRITINKRSITDLKQYRINNAGRFILSPNY